MSLHEDIPREVNKNFVSHPSNLGGSSLDPPRPPRPLGYFGLPMVNPGRPPLPPNRPYHRPFNYPEYVKDFDLDAHVRVFKFTIIANNEANDAKIVNLFSFTLEDIVFDWCNNYMGDYLDCTFVEL